MKKIIGILFILTIFFTINVNAANEKINVKEIKILEKSQSIQTEEPLLENNVISSHIKFNKIHDYVIYEVTLENKDDQDYRIKEIISNNENSSLKIESEYDKKISKNKINKIKIKLSYAEELPNSNNISIDNLEIKLKLTDSTGLESIIDLTNPKTGNSLIPYLFLLIISLVLIILVKKQQKSAKLFILLLLLITPISIYAEENFEIKFVISNIELVSDKLPKRVGSPVENFGGYNWHVIKSDEHSVTLMMDVGEHGSDLLPNLTNGKMAHCTSGESTNCTPYVSWTNQENREISSPTYSWKKSLINAYLNDESDGSFYKTLESQITGKEIVPARICDDAVQVDVSDYNRISNSPGYLDSEIDAGKCNEFGTYKVRLISRKEIFNIRDNILVNNKKEWFNPEGASSVSMTAFPSSWYGAIMITTLHPNYGEYYGTATYDGNIVRPVITIAQENVFDEEDNKQDIRILTSMYLEKAINEKKSLKVNRATYISDIDVKYVDSPTEGWVSFDVTEDGIKVKDYSLKIRNYAVDYSSDEADNMSLTMDGNVRQKPRVDYILDGTKYYDGANPVYFDPTGNDTNCSSSNYNTSGNTGCMKWWAYSEFEDNGTTYVNMILDHNTTQKTNWVSKADFDSATTTIVNQLGIILPRSLSNSTCNLNSGCTAVKGPITLLKQLKNDTNEWNAVSNRTDSYEVYLGSYMNQPKQLIYTLDYSSYKARLITAEEEYNVLHSKLKSTNETSSWLRSNLSSSGDPARGYYTASIEYYQSDRAYAIGMNYAEKINAADIGLRPVITMPKSAVGLK